MIFSMNQTINIDVFLPTIAVIFMHSADVLLMPLIAVMLLSPSIILCMPPIAGLFMPPIWLGYGGATPRPVLLCLPVMYLPLILYL